MWANLCDRQVHHDPGHRGDLESFVAGQQSRIVRELPGIDLAAGNPTQHVVGCRELFALSVLAAGKLDAGLYAVLHPMLDRVLSTPALL